MINKKRKKQVFKLISKHKKSITGKKILKIISNNN